MANMQWLCDDCHDPKSEAERLAGLRAFHAQRFREQEPHPGALPIVAGQGTACGGPLPAAGGQGGTGYPPTPPSRGETP